MKESQTTGELMMRWIPVVEANGRTRMEARWAVVAEPAQVHAAHAA